MTKMSLIRQFWPSGQSAKNGLFAKGFATIAIAALVSSGAGEL